MFFEWPGKGAIKKVLNAAILALEFKVDGMLFAFFIFKNNLYYS